MPETNFDFSVLETIPDTDAKIEVPDEVLEGPQTEEEQGVASLILDAISNSANTIQMYNAIIANCTDEEIIDSLNEILVDENRIMGKLQSILQKVSPNAEEIMNGAVEADQEMDPGSPIDESLRRLNEADRPDGAPINFWEPGGEDAEEYYQTNILTDMFDADPSRFEQALEDFGYNPTKYDNFDSFLKDVDKVDLLNKFADLLQKNDELNSSWYDHFDFTEAPLPFDFDESLNESSKSNASLTFKNNSGALELYAYNYVDPDLSDEEAIEYKERPYWKNWYKTRSEAVEDYKIIDSICNKYNVRIWPHDNHTFNNKNEVEIVGPSKNIIKKALNELRRRYDFEMIDESLKEDVFKNWKPNTSFKHIKSVLDTALARGKYINNERDEVFAALDKADKGGYTPEQRKFIKDKHREMWKKNRTVESFILDESMKKPIKEEAKKITRYSDVLPQKDRDRGWWYFTTHGVGPGTIPKDLNVLEIRDGQNNKGTWGTFVRLDGIVNTSELSYYDLTELAPPNVKNESLNESIAIKKNSTWIDTVGNDLCKVVDIKEVERKKRNVLGSFKDTDIIVQYDDSPRKFTFSKGEFLVRFVQFRKSYRESLNEDLLYANNIDKEILDRAGDKNIKPITTGTREKCSISAINNLKALLSKGESASLCLGQMKLKDEAPDPNSWISHVWVKSENGDILETNVDNIDFNSREHYCVKEIKFSPEDFENIGHFYDKLKFELSGRSANESLSESSRENIDQFIRNYLEHHPFDSAEEMIDYLEEYGEIEELEDRFHTDVEAAIEDYFEYLNESLVLDESNNLDTSLDDITPVRDEHNERAIRDHKKYKEDRKKAFKEISKNAKDAFELDESLFESFYLNYEDSDLIQDWDQGGLDFSVDIHPYKYEFYTSRDANKALKIAISHGYKDSWREGHYVYLTAH